MRHDRPVGRLRALGALVLLLGVVVGAPAAILATFGWPLTRGVLAVRRWPDALTGGQVSDDAVVRVLVTVALVVLAYLLACALGEVVALVRRRDRSTRSYNALSRWVRHLVAVAAVLVSTARPAVSLPGTAGPAPVAAVLAPPRTSPGVPVALPDAASGVVARADGTLADARDLRPGTFTVEAGRRDTLYSLAVRHLGDGERRDELLALNRGRVMVDGTTFDGTVRPGYRIVVPGESADDGDVAAAPTAAAAAAAAPARTYVVEPGDSLWSIAARLLGDGARYGEIHEANLGREVATGVAYLRTTTMIRPGWSLAIPPVEAAPPAVPAGTHVVASGESVWSIAAAELDARTGGGASAADVAGYVERTVEANAARFVRPGHPELVVPGQELVLPTVDTPERSTPPAAATHTRNATPDRTEASRSTLPPPMVVPAASSTVASVAAPQPPPGAPAADTTPGPVSPSTTPVVSSTPDASPASPVSSTPGALLPPASSLPTPRPVSATGAPGPLAPPAAVAEDPDDGLAADLAGLAGAVLLASGALATAVRLRHARLNRRRPGTRIAPPPAAVAFVERALRTHGDADLAHWGPLALRHLAPRLGTEWDGSFPLVSEVALAPEGVEITWTAPRATAVAPWRAADGGRRWRLERAALEPEVPEGVVPPCPGLATVGRRDASSVLVDVEAAGLVSIVGPSDRVAALGRSIVLELAVSDFADLLDIRLVGLPADGFEHLSRVHAVASLDQAMAWARPIRSGTDELLAEHAASSLFELRARQGATAVTHEPLVLVLAPGVLDEASAGELADVCRPGRGVVALVLGPVAVARVTVRVDERGEAEIVRDAGAERSTAVARALPADTLAGIGALFDHAATADEHVEPIALARRDAAPFHEPAPAVEVRLLGPVAVGAPGDADWDDVPARTLELIAWMVTRSGPEPARRALADLWPGRTEGAAAAFNHHLALARTRLGALDGELLLPPPTDDRYRLAPEVVSDLGRLERRLRWAVTASDATAVPVLRDGLALVRGRPFTTRSGYEWAHAEQLAFRAEQVVVDAAHRLAQLCLARRDTHGAVWATAAGLRGRPGDETLYQLRMKAFAAMGNQASVRLAMNELCAELQDLAGVDEPSDETAELYEQLMGRGRSA